MPNTKIVPINITIMSVGGRGANIMERLAERKMSGVRLVAVGSSGKTFNRLQLEEKIELQEEKWKTGDEMNEESMRQGVGDHYDAIRSVVEKTDILFLLGNLAGEGSAVHCSEIGRIARKCGKLTFFLGAMPFFFEGKPKIKQAAQNRAMLQKDIDGVLAIDADKLLAGDTSAQDAFTKTDQMVSMMIENVIDLVMKFGTVNVDFADLKTTVQNAGEVFFNSISLPRTEIDTFGKLLFSETSLNNPIRKLEKALYVIYAGVDLAMDEINTIGQKIAEHAQENARVIFGVVNDGDVGGDIKVVLIGA